MRPVNDNLRQAKLTVALEQLKTLESRYNKQLEALKQLEVLHSKKLEQVQALGGITSPIEQPNTYTISE